MVYGFDDVVQLGIGKVGVDGERYFRAGEGACGFERGGAGEAGVLHGGLIWDEAGVVDGR